MSILCRLGIHSWEVLNEASLDRIIAVAKATVEGTPQGQELTQQSTLRLQNCACRHCDKVTTGLDDELAIQIKIAKDEYGRHIRSRNKVFKNLKEV